MQALHLTAAVCRAHGCWRDAAAPLWVQPLAQLERTCCAAACSPPMATGEVEMVVYQNQAAGPAVCGGWAAQVPVGLPPAGGSPCTQQFHVLLQDLGAVSYRAGG